MKIRHLGIQRGDQPIHRQGVPHSPPGGAATERGAPTIASRLAAIFFDRGASVPTAHLAALEAELAALGMTADDLDPGTAFRALALIRAGVRLDPGLLTSAEGSVVARIGTVIASARALAVDPAIPLDIRVALTTFIEGMDSIGAVVGGDAEITGASVRESVQRSGMAFEWKMLALYRAGRLPGGLADLMRTDVKGLLAALLHELEAYDKAGRRIERLRELGRSVRTALDAVTGRQVDTALNDLPQRHAGATFEVPVGGWNTQDRAVVTVSGEKKSASNSLDPGESTIVFSVSTSRLGTVRVTMRARAQATAVGFELESDNACRLGADAADDLRDALAARGFVLPSVSFSVAGADAADEGGDAGRQGMDVVG